MESDLPGCGEKGELGGLLGCDALQKGPIAWLSRKRLCSHLYSLVWLMEFGDIKGQRIRTCIYSQMQRNEDSILIGSWICWGESKIYWS